ncbi:MAG: hypothetical protein JTJ30_07450 [Catenibacterium mitsuokai]|nr:hypothetical protein [Catenibacterium mitsuokai]MBN2931812.1 hypothetical protein [Catenibacterium mitsuokai]
MAKGSRGGKRAKRVSNAKYNGFSVTDQNGRTSHYKVINGKVLPAVEADGIHNMLKGIGSKNPAQALYDKVGSVDAVIKRVNKIGKGKASVLSDKAIDKMNADYLKKRKEFSESMSVRSSKKGVNRHRLYWSAM